MSALFSPCGLYRYRLSREWGEGDKLAFIMLNPSTADAASDDPTIRRCMGFSRELGYDGIVVSNLFAWRTTLPNGLKDVKDPVGPENDRIVTQLIDEHAVVICAWGHHGSLLGRGDYVLRMFRDRTKVPYCLSLTKGGNPSHPLYLPARCRPVAMNI